jgi:hypothetical protein
MPERTSSLVGHRTSPLERTKTCANPDCHMAETAQPWSNFYAKTKWEDGTMRQPHSRCKECHKASYRARRVKDPETHRRYRRNYYNKNTALELNRCRERREAIQQDPEARAALLESKRRRYRVQHNVPPERWRFEHRERQSRRTGETLPAAPFREWMRRGLREAGGDMTVLATMLDISLETVRRVVNGRVKTVDLGTVEAALCAHGSRSLNDLYG